jgi:bifunctional DNase/RNase
MYVEMKVYGLTLDSIAQMPVVPLKDAEGDHVLPIRTNAMHAVTIVAELISRNVSAESGRGDLWTKLLSRIRLTFDRIYIDGLNNGVFDISLVFAGECEEIKVCTRSSEALDMALKYDVTLHVSKHVLSQSSVLHTSDRLFFVGSDERRFVDFLENVDPRDLVKYPM